MVRLSDGLPGLEQIEFAEKKIRKFIPPTPLQFSSRLSDELGARVYLKLETFQPIGVFKIRGALNKIQSLDPSALRKGVITASSGNHGIAVAHAARLFGVAATVCVPENANPQKVAAIQREGATVLRHGDGYDQTNEYGLEESRRRDLTFLHAFDDADVIAGQGTCGLEIGRQLPDVDSTIVAIGGGGLISGVAIALKGLLPATRVYGVETHAIPSMYDSIRAGRRVKVVPKKTIADGMQASTPGKLTYAAGVKYLDGIGLVTDEMIEDAIFSFLSECRIVAEPAGASPLAAARGPLREKLGNKVVLVISGGNISLQLLDSIIRKHLGSS